MNKIDQVFRDLRARGKHAFMPFITAGDPDLRATGQLIHELSRRGANLIELGIPYSDPIADGPVIQASYSRALTNGVKLDAILSMVRQLDPALHRAPLVCMVAYAIIYRRGLEPFVRDAKQAGFEGAIVPDLPVEETADLASIAARYEFKLILLVTPTTPRERALEIARTSTGFLYYVSITGITGERSGIDPIVIDQVTWLKSQTNIPVCIGFGISTPNHVRMLAPVADGVIVGSAIVRRIAASANDSRNQMVSGIGEYVATLVDALDDRGDPPTSRPDSE